jgi:hypothetical protein
MRAHVKRLEVSNLNFLISSLPSIVFLHLDFTFAACETTTPKRLYTTLFANPYAREKAARIQLIRYSILRIRISRESAKLSWGKDGDMVDHQGMKIEAKAMV